MANNRRYLAHVFSPINVLSALVALEHVEPNGEGLADILIFQPGLPDQVQYEIADFARRVCVSFPIVRNVIVVTDAEWRTMVERTATNPTTYSISKIIPLDEVGTLLYAHDVVGDVVDVFRSAISGLSCICYGDAMGQIFERHVHLSYILDRSYHSGGPWRSLLSRWLNPMSGHKGPAVKRAVPDRAILILPVDQSGNVLSLVPYEVPGLAAVKSVFARALRQLTELQDYLGQELQRDYRCQRFFLLTENWAEGNFLPFEREIDLYEEVVRTHVSRGSVIWIKPHPGETLDRLSPLSERLGPEYMFRPVDQRFARIPFELWVEQFNDVGIIAMQYPALSLHYLYGIRVIQPLDYAMIDKYFPKKIRYSYKNALDLNMIPLRNLKSWDHRSPLFCGPR